MMKVQDRNTASINKELLSELGLANANQLPKLTKIVINVGLGRAVQDKKVLEIAAKTLQKISGQRPVQTKSKKSIAAYKLRAGMPIGLKVTLRGQRMEEFLKRLIWIVLPRLRDFHGLSPKSFDSQGNYTIGIPDQAVFPELTYEDTTYSHGLEITLVFSSLDPAHNRRLLQSLKFPLVKGRNNG